MKDVKILVAHHKEGLVINNGIYTPIHVGKALSNKDLGIQGDNEGDNISAKNLLYCEMTAWYWAWKNVKADYIGLCHYRRYFTFRKLPFYSRINLYIKSYGITLLGGFLGHRGGVNFNTELHESDFKSEAVKFSDALNKILQKKDYDAIVPRPWHLSNSNVYSHFEIFGWQHLAILDEIIQEKFPDDYSVYKESLGSVSSYCCNMAIFNYKYFMDYCNFMFTVLQRHEEILVEKGYCINPYDEQLCARISGYLAELLTNAFIYKMIREKRNVLQIETMFLLNS
jgi:hypothetical protein